MTAPRPIVFTDLDGTLFQTARKMPGDATNAHLAAEAKNGQHSYMTPAQEALVAWLNATTRLVPVTARSTEALARCTIVFRDWRVAANGAIILDPAGAPDPDWGTHIAQISRDWAPTLAGLEAKVAAGNGDGKLRHWIVREDGLPIYYCVKSNGDERWLDDVADELRSVAGLGLDVHRNG
ncbi:MAG: trehalose phosphatase, partial [Pseudomonadota bacterium]